MSTRTWALGAALLTLSATTARAEERSFAAGSLIVPMDLTYQDHGLLQAYGLLFRLLGEGVPVAWVIDADKTWHAAPCDTVGDLCAWDCAEEGSGVKCPYPTASPDFVASATVISDSDGVLAPGSVIGSHAYRGGPFVIAAADAARARPIIDAWNADTTRELFEVVSVHEATAAFTGNVQKDMVAAPTIAVFSDGNEDIATGYLRASGITQSNGMPFPPLRCGNAGTMCGPGTANPDMLTVASVAGDMGTCAAPSSDHQNGALFTAEGLPAYCQIMSMHWDVRDREAVQCDGDDCPATQAACTDEVITYHGHEVVAEVRSFLKYPVHFFAECQAVNAYENTTPNPAWPYLDDDRRDGHFLTTTGTPPPCPCTDARFECVVGGCAGADCCLPRNQKEQGAGFLIADRPADAELEVLRAGVAYNQMDGFFATVGGSEPAYNLSTYLGTAYKNDREVTFITGANGPGDQDLWMTGYADGTCDIGDPDDDVGGGGGGGGAACGTGKVSYLGGHAYAYDMPMSNARDAQGARLFLNALFEADCVTAEGQPRFALDLDGPLVVGSATLPATASYDVTFSNGGAAPALDGLLALGLPASITAVSDGATIDATGATWDVGAIGGDPGNAGDPASAGTRTARLTFPDYGDYEVTVGLSYRAGVSRLDVGPQTFTIRVTADTTPDGGGGGGGGNGDGDDGGGCGCHVASRREATTSAFPWLVAAVAVVLARRRLRAPWK